MLGRGDLEKEFSGRQVSDGGVEKDLGLLGLLEGERKVNFNASLLAYDICNFPGGDLLTLEPLWSLWFRALPESAQLE